jgi:hypothetical protein
VCSGARTRPAGSAPHLHPSVQPGRRGFAARAHPPLSCRDGRRVSPHHQDRSRVTHCDAATCTVVIQRCPVREVGFPLQAEWFRRLDPPLSHSRGLIRPSGNHLALSDSPEIRGIPASSFRQSVGRSGDRCAAGREVGLSPIPGERSLRRELCGAVGDLLEAGDPHGGCDHRGPLLCFARSLIVFPLPP